MSEPLWSPRRLQRGATTLGAYAHYLRDAGLFDSDGENYQALWQWSVADPARFWETVWKFCDVRYSQPHMQVLDDPSRLPGARWFEGARLNFAENLLRFHDSTAALVALDESGRRREISYAELQERVRALAAALRQDGVEPGDRVAAFLPNCAEAVTGMLAATSLGATWTSCSPDFGLSGVLDRFGQIAPKVLIVCDGYRYGGKAMDTMERVARIEAALPSLRRVVVVPYLDEVPTLSGLKQGVLFDAYRGDGKLEFAQLPFDHPLYILYSSGTTGMPKCIVHGAGGTLLQHLKEHMLHGDLQTGDRLFFFTSCGWMMWNWLVSGLAVGATLVLYDGSPFHPGPEVLMEMAEREQLTHFGTSPRYLAALEQSGWVPRDHVKLDALRVLLSTGSPLGAEQFDYVYGSIKRDLQLASISGGTDIASCFALGNPWSPVFRGEIQGPGLGMALEVYDELGKPVRGQSGELVCTKPFPSMPVAFRGDPDGSRYRAAYFERFPDVWCQGDCAEFTVHGGLVISSRSDATLNPGGVRIGTAEIYRVVDTQPEVLESVVVGQRVDNDDRVILFVRLREGVEWSEDLGARIARAIRAGLTPRHVPARILACPEVPRTISGKITEIAVRELIHGRPVRNADTLANPQSLDYFKNLSPEALR
ncbi:acetoacetate--CoA ligase [Solimonas sp. SE-A11]|uniref:acetoacetate--CoA ligase n=1 Tax=Solimonas sp. SE-A11 TaxID=3054954 RepID=UPI00259CB0C2|nr:acetoacetate--CoA ligase [Solimonas sp. SE-A11]MDM4770018.1 acetoacetate--CoA ligase [Solimonas sp. SE-A11]